MVASSPPESRPTLGFPSSTGVLSGGRRTALLSSSGTQEQAGFPGTGGITSRAAAGCGFPAYLFDRETTVPGERSECTPLGRRCPRWTVHPRGHPPSILGRRHYHTRQRRYHGGAVSITAAQRNSSCYPERDGVG